MRTFIAIALALAVLHSSAYAKDKSDCPEFAGANDTFIYHKCKKEYPDDFNMLKYCIDSQQQALANLKQRFCNLTKNEEKL